MSDRILSRERFEWIVAESTYEAVLVDHDEAGVEITERVDRVLSSEEGTH